MKSQSILRIAARMMANRADVPEILDACTKPMVSRWRKQYNIPESYYWFECLYNGMKKREQRKQGIHL